MIERSYTVREINDLRETVKTYLMWGSYIGPYLIKSQMSNAYNSNDLDKKVEEQVRTHMMAGHIAKDLIDEGYRTLKEHIKMFYELESHIKPDVLEVLRKIK